MGHDESVHDHTARRTLNVIKLLCDREVEKFASNLLKLLCWRIDAIKKEVCF